MRKPITAGIPADQLKKAYSENETWLPPIKMAPLRELVQDVFTLEQMAAGEYVPEGNVPACAFSDHEKGMVLPAISQKLANIHLAVKGVLRLARASFNEPPP